MRRLIKWIKRMWHGPEPHYWILTVLDPVMNEKYVIDLHRWTDLQTPYERKGDLK